MSFHIKVEEYDLSIISIQMLIVLYHASGDTSKLLVSQKVVSNMKEKWESCKFIERWTQRQNKVFQPTQIEHQLSIYSCILFLSRERSPN